MPPCGQINDHMNPFVQDLRIVSVGDGMSSNSQYTSIVFVLNPFRTLEGHTIAVDGGLRVRYTFPPPRIHFASSCIKLSGSAVPQPHERCSALKLIAYNVNVLLSALASLHRQDSVIQISRILYSA